jgi:hypothetical protein
VALRGVLVYNYHDMKDEKDISAKKYVIVFFLTLGVFAVIFLLSNYLYSQRINQVKNIEDSISQNILESEIQYSLLADASCENDAENSPAMVNEINNLAQRLSYMEEQRGTDDTEVIGLKKYYSLLQIKDYLLLRERAKQCAVKPSTILYFYSNQGDCGDECKKLGYVLTSMREDYADLHVYAFDYNLGLSVIDTLKSIYSLEGKLPILVINRKAYYGYKTREEIERLMPELAFARATSTKAATTSR